MMWALLAIILAVTAAMILGTRSPNRMPPRAGDERFDPGVADDAPPEEPTIAALIRDNPVEALRRYGTSDDAARLIEEGRGDELKGLGWRDPNG
ncbi:hypothetical protein GGR88_002291 [Sphingomonas jejuensis]|uniref:Uncharacterized protein n=1 Tax=Sphingomonas jejuensis TaxID=904715 RepID=A0ABX0XPJ5_9SPHN|nr:hypothetical protein [Sphingomonas jejuensis]NJC34777.1 hypothetical protein [Sphingomonas jejuensis]